MALENAVGHRMLWDPKQRFEEFCDQYNFRVVDPNEMFNVGFSPRRWF
jgi:hypothetical protein